MQKFGIDISHHQGVIDFAKVKADPANISFAYIKATEGQTYNDPMAKTNALGCKTNGIAFGYYHFARPAVTNPGLEALHFATIMKTLPAANMLPVLDLEVNDNKLTPAQMQRWVSDFINRMKQLGFSKIRFYSYTPFINDNLPPNHPFGNLSLWIAAYNSIGPRIPNGWKTFDIWQNSDSGTVNGITGKVDTNRTGVNVDLIVGISTISLGIILIILILILL